MDAWRKGAKGLPANRPRNGEDRTCKHCGAAFYVPLSRIKQNARFCRHACYIADRWGPSRVQTRSCVMCGSTFRRPPSDPSVTCGRVCGNKYRAQNISGERSHFWRGGKAKPYDAEWRRQRVLVRERDGNTCTICGSTDRPQVHHIIPWRYSRSHALENLTVLCRSCHSVEEIKVNEAMRAGLIHGRLPGGAARRLS